MCFLLVRTCLLFLSPLVLGAAESTGDVSECTTPNLDLVVLVDACETLPVRYPEWQTTTQQLIDIIAQGFSGESVRAGLSSFTDKPIPYYGTGQFGNYENSPQDRCYSRHQPLSADTTLDLELPLLPRYDYMQAQLEALIFAALDTDMQWQPAGPDAIKLAFVVTPSEMHKPRDAWSSRNNWNWERQYPNGYQNVSHGGFGCDDFPNPGIINIATTEDAKNYSEMAGYFHTIDGFEAQIPEFENNITDAQAARLELLIEKFGPYPYPELEYPEHPGDASVPDCAQSEYPAAFKTGNVLKEQGILPIFLVTGDLFNYYQRELRDLGAECIILALDAGATPAALAETLFFELAATHCFPAVSGPRSSTFNPIFTRASSTSTAPTAPSGDTVAQALLDTAATDEAVSGATGKHTQAVPGASGNTHPAAVAGATVGASAGVAALVASLYRWRSSAPPVATRVPTFETAPDGAEEEEDASLVVDELTDD